MSTIATQPLLFCTPRPKDFRSLAALQTAAFAAKKERFESSEEVEENHFKTYQRYQRECPSKLQQCCIIKSLDDETKILAACQLNKRRRYPATSQNKNADPDNGFVVFVEWIACDPEQMNKGLGSALLEWAATFTKDELKVSTLSLFVVQANSGAVRLYQRRGFVIQCPHGGGPPNRCARACTFITTVLCFGLNRHWNVLTMEKDLGFKSETDTISDGSSRGDEKTL